MQNFFLDHCQDAFGCMSEILGENFNFKQRTRERRRSYSVNMWKVKNVLNMMKFKICQQSYSCRALDAYSALMSDVVHDVPTELLGALLYEELTEQRDNLLFSEGATGGALAFVPFLQSDSNSQQGCLLYPRNQRLDCLNFHRVELQQHRGSSLCVDASSSDPFSFQLKGPVRQICFTSLFNNCCVAVRSDHLCGVWRFSERNKPRLLQVIKTKEVATCINVSPHVLGEVLVVSESGTAKLWTVGRGMQTVREEESNLYFNAKSSWRWCEFSAHPRVMLYADRTGVELTDIRMNPAVGHTLFRISNTSECRSGERLILSRYLGEVHPFHHLVTTQHSAYIMDERFPSMPMLKWDHMMKFPPMFCHVIPGSTSSGSSAGEDRIAKVLLGSQSSQEITLLQYSGGRADACFSLGPPQSLLRPRDSLKHLPVQIPHRLHTATNRLSSPAAGLTCIQNKGDEECICVLQLTETGDIFYQILELVQRDTSRPPAAEDEPQPQQAEKKLSQPTLKKNTASGGTAQRLQEDSLLLISDTSSDDDVIGPTQRPGALTVVPETPEKDQRAPNMFSFSSSEDSESEEKGRNLRRLLLNIIVNDPELNHLSGADTGVKDGVAGKNDADDTVEPGGVGETISNSSCLSHTLKLSDSTRVTWKRWLQKLMRKSRKKKPRSHCLQHLTIKTEGLLHLSEDAVRDVTEEERVQSLQRDLRACMSKRSLLVHSAVSGSLGALDVEPVPNLVDTEDWTDPLSQRLTVSWQGKEAWRAWWVDQLGLNWEEKLEALRRKRRREKDAKRAAGQRLELSGSFTSSISYQSELDDFSDSTGWSSAASQSAWSDTEDTLFQSESGTPKAATPVTMQTDSPVCTPTPQSVKDKRSEQLTPSSTPSLSLSQIPKPDLTPPSQRRNKRIADYLSSLFAPQDEVVQHDRSFLEEESTVPSQQSSMASSYPGLRSSQSFPQRSVRVNMSQEAFPCSGSSQSLSQSQGRLGRSPSSQPKKKSRMGF